MLAKIFVWFESRLAPYPDFKDVIPTDNFRAFLRFSIKGMGSWLVYFSILGMLFGLFEASLFWMLARVVDILNSEAPATLWMHQHLRLIGFFFLVLLSIPLVFLSDLVEYQTLMGVFPMRLRWWFHHILMAQSMRFFQDEFSGRVSAKIMQTALAVREMVLTLLDVGVRLTVYFLTSGFILMSFDAWLLMPFGAWILLLSAAIYIMVPKIAKVTQEQANARSLMTGRVTDTYANIATVKLFVNSGQEKQYAKEAMEEFLVTVNAQFRLVTKLNVTLHSLNMLLILGVGGLGIWLWRQNAITVGALSAAIALALRLNSLSVWLIYELARLFENMGVVKDGMMTFSHKPEIVDADDATELKVSESKVEYRDITFAYTPGKPVFNHFSLTIYPKEKIGLVGRSGSGKSTLINLLLRFYEVDSGAILIDNQDIRRVTQESLRGQIALVTQDTSLLHRSIGDNIRYGTLGATDQQVIEAAKRAQAHNFITTLVDKYGHKGYDTIVGERGVKLSGGQRQRISIARVMLKNAPILILDEATSALDSEVEAAIQDTLYDLMGDKTVIAIAHRLSTIAAMDRLVVMDEGAIVEMGTHEQLLRQGGLYARLWQRQSGGFLSHD